MQRRTFIKTTGAAGGIGLLGITGAAQEDFPDESLTWMIPWAEGGGTDQFARQFAPVMEDPLEQSIEIDNRPGAGSLLGSEWLHEQDPDGLTFGTVNSPAWEFNWLVQEIDDWHVSDFEPISFIGVFGYTIIVNDDYEIDSFEDLRDAYADGEMDNFAFQGVGTDTHMISFLLRDDFGLEWDNIVPFDGGGPVNEAVISGEVPAGIATNTSAAAAEESDRVSAVVNLMDIDITDAFPDIDEITEYGESLAFITEFRQTQVAPPDTPEDVRDVIGEAAGEAAESDAVAEWAEETGNIIEFGDRDEATEILDGAVDELEERVDFDDFRRTVEEEA